MLLQFAARRVLITLPTLLGVALLVFVLGHLAPGDPALAALGVDLEAGSALDEAAIERARRELGLDRPLAIQFLQWMGGVLTGDLGQSFVSRHTVGELIASALPTTLLLVFSTITVAALIGISVGILSAVMRGRAADYVARLLTITGVSMPTFWLALVLLLLFAFHVPLFPMGGSPEEHGLKAMVLPVAAIALHPAALIARMMRSSMLETLSQDYVRTAVAKGLGPLGVIAGHAARNAINPVITVMGFQFGNLMGGAIAIEVIFSLPGLGSALLTAIEAKDILVIQGIVLVIGLAFALANLTVDVLYVLIDPRIRL